MSALASLGYETPALSFTGKADRAGGTSRRPGFERVVPRKWGGNQLGHSVRSAGEHKTSGVCMLQVNIIDSPKTRVLLLPPPSRKDNALVGPQNLISSGLASESVGPGTFPPTAQPHLDHP